LLSLEQSHDVADSLQNLQDEIKMGVRRELSAAKES